MLTIKNFIKVKLNGMDIAERVDFLSGLLQWIQHEQAIASERLQIEFVEVVDDVKEECVDGT